MDSLIVKTKDKNYPIYFGKNFSDIADVLKNAGICGNKVCVVSDSNVGRLYIKTLTEGLEAVSLDVEKFEFEAGEKNKNLGTIEKMYDFFAEKHLDRKSVIVCLGGGVCGDMAGFAASTFMRGIKFIQIPTTLLAQVDSSVGGKVGVDFKGNKNMIGAFSQPEIVYMALDVLDTLPKREFSAGMAEVIKYGVIAKEDFLIFLEENKEKIREHDKRVLSDMIKRCCEIKSQVVENDEKDTGEREILNFGHTIGHAVETKKNFELLHGECVAIGMKAALEISEKRGYISDKTVKRILSLLEYFNLPLSVSAISAEEIYSQMFLDKKVKNNIIRFVLMKDFGVCERTDNVKKEEIISAINKILR